MKITAKQLSRAFKIATEEANYGDIPMEWIDQAGSDDWFNQKGECICGETQSLIDLYERVLELCEEIE
tara:strand:- start:190 stop:393 length:204 start_codon:yes stop_codon:yes gene_type:complete